jgi:hypothetical protein
MHENSPSQPGATFDWQLNRTWWLFFEKLAKAKGGKGGGPYVRTLLLKNTAVGNDIADRVPIWQAGTGVRVIGVLRDLITSDLTVRVNMNGTPLTTLTIPHGTAKGTPVLGTAFTPPGVTDLAVLSWDVTASDGSTDPNGVASFTVQWQ